MDFTEVLRQIHALKKHRVDYTVSPRSLSVSEEGHLLLDEDKHLVFNDWSLGQLCSKLGVPIAYTKKTIDARPDLMAQHLNYWLEKTYQDESRDVLLRTQGFVLRAYLSDRYSILDNDFLIEAVQEMTQSRAQVKDFWQGERTTHLRLVFPDLSVKLGNLPDGKPDKAMVGVHISNSEVGASAVRIEGLIFRLVCANGLMVATKNGQDAIFQQRHFYLKEHEIRARVGEAIGTAIRASHDTVERFIRSRAHALYDPMLVIDELITDNHYSAELGDTIRLAYEEEPHASAFGVVNALTRAARILPIEHRVEMERAAVNYLLKAA